MCMTISGALDHLEDEEDEESGESEMKSGSDDVLDITSED